MASTQPASPSQLNGRGHPARGAGQQKAKESSDQKHPRKAAHSRRSPGSAVAPDETTEIRKPKSRCGGDGGEHATSVPVSFERAGAIPARGQQSAESQKSSDQKAPKAAALAAMSGSNSQPQMKPPK